MNAATLTHDEVKALDRVVEYLWDAERESYESSKDPEGHIFNQVLILDIAMKRFHKEGKL